VTARPIKTFPGIDATRGDTNPLCCEKGLINRKKGDSVKKEDRHSRRSNHLANRALRSPKWLAAAKKPGKRKKEK